jgi:N-glycosylase/DNA lyase
MCVPQTTWKKTKEVITKLQAENFYKRHIQTLDLEQIVKPVRFYRRKAHFLQELKLMFPYVLILFNEWQEGEITSVTLRDEIAKKVKGMGMKTTSQFLRNLGVDGLAIIDTHILKYLGKDKVGGRKEYLQYEQIFRRRAQKLGISTSVLDTVIWKQYSNTEWDNFNY